VSLTYIGNCRVLHSHKEDALTYCYTGQCYNVQHPEQGLRMRSSIPLLFLLLEHA